MDYKIVLNNFEGPLDLLLKLIDKSKIDIYDIPISDITEQYMSYMYKMEDLNLELASDFIVMAATLLEIKSKMLLPIERNSDEDDTEEDPREELVLKLLAYKKYKEAAKELREYEKIELQAFYKPQDEFSFEEDTEEKIDFYNLNLLVRSLNNILHRRGIKEPSIDIELIKREEYSIKKCVEDILDKLKFKKEIRFSRLFNKDANKNQIIAYFLSLLELIKQKNIYVLQNDSFDELFINKLEDKE